MKFNYRKPAVAAAIVGGVLAVSGTAAFAYWTAQGTGSGTAGTASASIPLTITQDTFNGSALTPGGAAQQISGTVTNNNTFQVPFALTTSLAVDSAHSTCDLTAYTVSLTTSPTTVAANNHADFKGTIKMADAAGNQDNCKGATITINYTATSS